MKKIVTLTSLLSITLVGMFAQPTPQPPNAGFEAWTGSGTTIEATNYHSNKSGTGNASIGPQTCFRDASVFHSGTYSARIETISYIGTAVNGALTSGLVNAPTFSKADGYIGTRQGASGTDIRRIAFDGRPDSLVGYYRYTQSTTATGTGGANEVGKVYAILHLGNYYDPSAASSYHPDSSVNKVGQALFLTPASNVGAWTRFSVPFSYVSAVTPQYILLNCTSSNNQLTSVAGSKLWLDDISVVYLCANTVTANATNSSICSGTSTSLMAGGSATYNWMPGNLSGTNVSVSPTSTTTYTLTGTTSGGCVDTAVKTITVLPLPLVNANASVSAVCSGSPVTLTGSGNAISYTWSGGAADGVPFVPVATATYTVTGTGSNTCTHTATTTVTVNPVPGVTGQSGNQMVTDGTNADFFITSPQSGETYQWQSDLGAGWVNLMNTGQYSGVTTDTVHITPALLANNNQPFRCIITLGPCSFTSSQDILNVTAAVGINEIAENSFSISPNPVSDFTTILFATKQKQCDIIIRDVIGKTIYRKSFSESNSCVLDMTGIQSGIYFMTLTDGKMEMGTKKITVK